MRKAAGGVVEHAAPISVATARIARAEDIVFYK
jgi:hypothetical protein